MDLGLDAATVGDDDRRLGAAVDHMPRGDPDTGVSDGKCGADTRFGLAGHIDHHLRIEG